MASIPNSCPPLFLHRSGRIEASQCSCLSVREPSTPDNRCAWNANRCVFKLSSQTRNHSELRSPRPAFRAHGSAQRSHPSHQFYRTASRLASDEATRRTTSVRTAPPGPTSPPRRVLQACFSFDPMGGVGLSAQRTTTLYGSPSLLLEPWPKGRF